MTAAAGPPSKRRRRPRTRPRSRVVPYKRLGAEVRAARDARDVGAVIDRPRLREHCEPCEVCQAVRDGELVPIGSLACGHRLSEVIFRSRPCVFVGCRPNLYLDVTETGSIKLTRPGLEPEDMPKDGSCVLDVAERGALTLEEVGEIENVSRERARQLEVRALLTYRQNGGGALRDG